MVNADTMAYLARRKSENEKVSNRVLWRMDHMLMAVVSIRLRKPGRPSTTRSTKQYVQSWRYGMTIFLAAHPFGVVTITNIPVACDCDRI